MKRLIFIIIMTALAYFWLHEPSMPFSPGVTAPNDPNQTEAINATAFEHEGYTITPLAHFSLTAKVLSHEKYYLGRESDLSPLDLTFGWGPMSDDAILQNIHISQSNRWYHWSVESFPIPQNDIETHSANMHMIPANDNIKKQLNSIKRGNTIELEGDLIEAEASDGWKWRSSLSRDDTGGGSCEVVWVKRVVIK